jgi:enediyne biosynthesis protein E4
LNSAAWIDIDNDKKPDLIIAGDWMPIRIFKNTGTSLSEITESTGLRDLTGFWRSVAITDIDRDGDMDIVAGNIGLNNPFHINSQQPAELIAKDFDGNGAIENIFCYYIKDNNNKYQLSSGISRNEWADWMPSIKKKFGQNGPYAKATMDEIFTAEMMDRAMVLTCRETRSGYFQNDGKSMFAFHAFPLIVQGAPVNATLCTDVDNDGNNDILLAGNEYQSAVMTGRYDALYGLCLKGDGKGNFEPLSPALSGFIVDGDVKDLKFIMTAKQEKIIIAAINNEPLKAFKIKKGSK